MRLTRYIFYILCLLNAVDCLSQPWIGNDTIISRDIKSVFLYPKNDNPNATIVQPIIPLDQSIPLQLDFDILGEEDMDITMKIFHCTYDWKPSFLVGINFLNEFNEFNLRNRVLSYNTRVPYIHYSTVVPWVKYPGNYIVKVFEEGNEDNVLFVKRFMVYENKVEISNQFPGRNANTPQQYPNFNLLFSPIAILNPLQNLKVIMRQNYRWDKTLTDPRPTQFRADNGFIEYNLVLEKAFQGENEFRVFDMRSLLFRGMNIDRIKIDSVPVPEVQLAPSLSRSTNTYQNEIDINGQYVIDRYETGNGATYGDYAFVYFTLHSPEKMVGDVYVFGALSEWKLKDEFKMKYDSADKMYYCRPLLKQGYYNYRYVIKRPNGTLDETTFENNFFEAENQYDVLVCYKNPNDQIDYLLGYKSFQLNPRVAPRR